VQLLDDEL
jgi:hypothetical protein